MNSSLGVNLTASLHVEGSGDLRQLLRLGESPAVEVGDLQLTAFMQGVSEQVAIIACTMTVAGAEGMMVATPPVAPPACA